MTFVYKIADVVFGADIKYSYTYSLMKDYLAPIGSKPEFTIAATEEDIRREYSLSPYKPGDGICESTALYRKFIYILMDKYDGFFFHCSAVAVENRAIMFTAQSGTGKSTHRGLWVKNYKDRVVVINDDKPVVRKTDGVFFVYGTPWQGKENLGCNIKVPAKALCLLSRSKTNSICKAGTAAVVARMMNQVIRPQDMGLMDKLLALLDEFITQVDCYDLRVNMDDSAAVTAYEGIMGNR